MGYKHDWERTTSRTSVMGKQWRAKDNANTRIGRDEGLEARVMGQEKGPHCETGEGERHKKTKLRGKNERGWAGDIKPGKKKERAL